ncbi:PqiC family protein [Geoalkalibacter halelectricus]|uniref:PqiC family protein n=1 Tax=Geoalkalibacter halelectricus TaxID=2847045 RepID=A0ABY5ZJ62_9BACT|nr:PqiC family protein [Geoalkalibacter halelectricus]MDO3378239.1 PqiC family protein [Geoalkalibacter halelectricus]UWZ79170.1 PqiC family protein [Geoalkalibacter halelectricus]
MTTPIPIPGRRALLLLGALVLGGCLVMGEGRVEQTRYFTLAPTQDENLVPLAEHQPDWLPGVGPVRLAAYLDRPQLLTRRDAFELEVIEAALWAEPLQENLARTLAANLAALTASPRVPVFPWRATAQPTHQISVTILRFDSGPEPLARLQAQWAIQTQKGGPPLVSRQSHLSAPMLGEDAAAAVAALSATLGALSLEIAEALGALAAENKR